MAADNLARGMAASKLSAKGGDLTGDLHITGNLTVDGVTKTTEQETLIIKDNMIVTNADGATLSNLMSGLGIRNGSTNVYGIVYDPVSNSVKFGIGSLDSQNRFSFNTGEGHPLAIRADSNTFTDGHYIKWDAANNMLVDGGGSSGDNVITSAVFGVHTGDNFTEGQTMYINTDMPIETVVNVLSNIVLKDSVQVEGAAVYAIATIFEDDVVAGGGSEGVYMCDLSKLGGTGYIIYSAIVSNQVSEFTHVLFISDVTDENNATIIQEFMPLFVMPETAGWTMSSFNLATDITGVYVLRSQDQVIVDAYSKYISCAFSTDRRMWDLVNCMIGYSVDDVLNTPV